MRGVSRVRRSQNSARMPARDSSVKSNIEHRRHVNVVQPTNSLAALSVPKGNVAICSRFIRATPVRPGQAVDETRALLFGARCVRARMQICKFVAKHKRGPGLSFVGVRCGPSKSRKTPWAPSFPGAPPAPSLVSRVNRAHVRAYRVHARAFAPARCVYLRQSGPRFFKAPAASFPGIALSGPRRR